MIESSPQQNLIQSYRTLVPQTILYSVTTPKNKKEKLAIKKRRIKSEKADAAEKDHTYGIDSLNIADTVYKAGYYSIQRQYNASGHDSE